MVLVCEQSSFGYHIHLLLTIRKQMQTDFVLNLSMQGMFVSSLSSGPAYILLPSIHDSVRFIDDDRPFSLLVRNCDWWKNVGSFWLGMRLGECDHRKE